MTSADAVLPATKLEALAVRALSAAFVRDTSPADPAMPVRLPVEASMAPHRRQTERAVPVAGRDFTRLREPAG